MQSTAASFKYTDSHCHLDFEEFDHDRTAILQQCDLRQVHRIIVPSITPINWQKVLTLATSSLITSTKTQSKCQLYACLGIHPWFLQHLNDEHLTQLATQVQRHQQHIIAIGETGIDGVIAKQQNNLKQQQHFFDVQLQLAKQQNLPLIVHHRQSHQETIPMIKSAALSKGGIIHAFSGSYQQAKQYIDLGFSLGVGATITYERAKKTINAIKRVPLNSLVLETDAPAMPLSGLQGKINSPVNIPLIFQQLCAIREESPSEIASQIETNIDNLFFNA